MANDKYIIIPGTQKKVYDGTVVMLYRLPNIRWILHNGYYNYNGKKQKGWYFSSIPSDTTMPVFNEDLVAMKIIDESPTPVPPIPPHPPIPPFPPGPVPPGPVPPAPIPIPFTPQDKQQVDQAMLTVDNLIGRDKLSSKYLQNGKIVRVNDADGEGNVEYFSWNAETEEWELASLGYRYMTREEIETAISDDIIDIVWSNEDGALVLTNKAGETESVILSGVAHDPEYNPETLELRIPRYDREDLVIKIPDDMYIRSIRFEPDYEFPDGTHGPAIVVVVSDGTTTKEIAGDASGLIDIYKGGETDTATVVITQSDNVVKADVKISNKPKNRLKFDVVGMYVDVSDLEERLDNLENPPEALPEFDGELIVTAENGLAKSAATIGGDELSDSDTNVAKEKAIIKAISWQTFE